MKYAVIIAIGLGAAFGAGCGATSASGGGEPSELQISAPAGSPEVDGGPCDAAVARAAERIEEAARALRDEIADKWGRYHRRYCDDPQTCSSPRYTDGQPGTLVPFDARTFPGGRDFRIATVDETPRWGEAYEFERPTARFERLSLRRVNLTNEDYPLFCFRYVYETGSGSGASARATLRAEVDQDPSDPKNFTMLREISVDDRTGEVEIGPLVVLHRGK